MARSSSTPTHSLRLRRSDWRRLALVLVIVLVLYVLVPQVSAFSRSLIILEGVQWHWAALAALFYVMTSVAGCGMYLVLSPRSLPVGPTLLVQYAGSFINRLVPAGLGALGVGYAFLRKQKYTPPQALAILGLNNTFGFVGHALLVMGALFMTPRTREAITFSVSPSMVYGGLTLVVVAVVTLVVVSGTFRHRLLNIARSTAEQLLAYRRRPGWLVTALVITMILTSLFALALWSSARALGGQITFAEAIIILAVGVGLGAVVPLPGGIGGAEAGLVAGLIAYRADPGLALAIAILYRLASYWLGFLMGAVTFYICEQKGYV